jgi:hypothetical protein
MFGVPIGKPIDHELRDHLAIGRPRGHDFRAAATMLDADPTEQPAWMVHRWQ